MLCYIVIAFVRYRRTAPSRYTCRYTLHGARRNMMRAVLSLAGVIILTGSMASPGAGDHSAATADTSLKNDGDYPKWLASTRCTAGVEHAEAMQPTTKSLETIPFPVNAFMNTNSNTTLPSVTPEGVGNDSATNMSAQKLTESVTEKTRKPYIAPPQHAPSKLFLDDE